MTSNVSDPRKVRASLMSSSDSQQHCVIFLEKYFSLYGDAAPNQDEIKLAVTRKNEIYKAYVEDSKSLERACVDVPTFYKIWKALFPRCVSRPWCDIPGKCNTCYEIDRMRRESVNPAVQEKLQEAHALHRGGMFMLERNE